MVQADARIAVAYCWIRCDICNDTSGFDQVAHDFVAVNAGWSDSSGPLAVAALEDELVRLLVLARIEHVGTGADSQRMQSRIRVDLMCTIRDRI